MEQAPNLDNLKEDFLKKAKEDISRLSSHSITAIYDGNGIYDVQIPEELGDISDDIKEIAREILEDRR